VVVEALLAGGVVSLLLLQSGDVVSHRLYLRSRHQGALALVVVEALQVGGVVSLLLPLGQQHRVLVLRQRLELRFVVAQGVATSSALFVLVAVLVVVGVVEVAVGLLLLVVVVVPGVQPAPPSTSVSPGSTLHGALRHLCPRSIPVPYDSSTRDPGL
jgi:hypothetical protein